MILVSVCQNKSLDLLCIADQVRDVIDNEVYAEHIVIGESKSAINDEYIVAVFKDGQVFSDFTQTAERNDAQFFEFSFRSRHRVFPFFISGLAIKDMTKNLEHMFLLKQ